MYLQRNEQVNYIRHINGMTLIVMKENSLIEDVIEVNRSAAEIIDFCTGEFKKNEVISQIIKKNEINDKEIKQSIEDYLNYLMISNFIVKIEEKSYNEGNNIFGDYSRYAPLSASIDITKRCQLKCIHCYNNSGGNTQKEMTKEDIIFALNKLKETGVQKLLITGGEPFLHKDIDEIIESALSKFPLVYLNTNGYKINSSTLLLLEKYRERIKLTLSIDGLEENHDYIRGVKGSFKKAMLTIKELVSRKIGVHISYTMNAMNTNDLFEVAHLVKSSGCSGISTGYIIEEGRAIKSKHLKSSVDSYLAEMSRVSNSFHDDSFFALNESCESESEDKRSESNPNNNKCGAGYKLFHITVEGDIHPCPTINKIKMGNLFSEDIKNIFSSERVKRIVDIQSPISIICSKCKEFKLCKNCISRAMEKSATNCRLKKHYEENEIIY